jgi:hypothetical protein
MDRSRRKICERSTKIGPVRVIASLHLISSRIKGAIPKYPGDPPLPPLRGSNDEDEEGEDQDFIDDLIRKAAERRKTFVSDMAPAATFGISYYIFYRELLYFHFTKQFLSHPILIELLVYIPQKHTFLSIGAIPACSKFRVILKMSDIAAVLSNIEDLTIASEALFEVFFDNASAEETLFSETVWLQALFKLLKKFSWGIDKRHEISPPEAIPNFKVGDIVEARYQARQNWYAATIVAVAEDQSTFNVDYDDGEKETGVARELIRFPMPTDIDTSESFTLQMKKALQTMNNLYLNEVFTSSRIALQMSSVVYRNAAIKMISETLRSDETMRNPVMQVYIWVKGSEIGFIFYDMELEQVHVIQQKDPAAQSVRI